MSSWKPISVLVLTFVALVKLEAGVDSAETISRSLEVDIPEELDLRFTSVEYAVGNLISRCDASMRFISGCKISEKDHRLTLNLDNIEDFNELNLLEADTLKLMLHSPGYRIAIQEFPVRNLTTSATWYPEAVAVPSTRIHGIAFWEDGQPVTEGVLEITYSLIETMRYFGYVDGSVPQLKLAEIAPDASGHFSAELPKITTDPFIDAESQIRLVTVLWRKDRSKNDNRDPRSLHLTLKALYESPLALEFERAERGR